MKVGDKLELQIIDDNINGDGIAKLDGIVIIVPYTAKGDVVKVEITKVSRSYILAKVIKLISKSTNRVNVECPLFRKCGGCSLLHQEYKRQLQIKAKHVQMNFKKIAGIKIDLPNIKYKKQFHYRNKVQLPIGKDKDGKVVVGYYKNKTHEIVSQKECLLATKLHNDIVKIFIYFANKNKLTTYNESMHIGMLRHLIIRQLGDKPYITLVVNDNTNIENIVLDFKRELKKNNVEAEVLYSLNNKKTNVIMTGDAVYRNTKMESCSILKVDCEVSQKSFMQVNSEVRDIMYKDVIDLAIKAGGTIIEGYSGIGVFSSVIAKKVKAIYSIEVDELSHKDAELLKIKNCIYNMNNILGDATIEIPRLVKEIDDVTTILVDPPRKGLSREITDSILKSKVKNIIYVSCDSSTLARDIKELALNYKINLICCYDMFPNTSHVECIALIQRVKS